MIIWNDERNRSANVNIIDCKLTITVRSGDVRFLMYGICSCTHAYDLLLSGEINHFEDN